jgi:hypothetical protein
VFSFSQAPQRAFQQLTLPGLAGGLSWDTSDLLASGSIAVVPEPGSWLLRLAGLAATGAVVRRRRG